MVDKEIDVIYRPWEEKDENLRYKEERKKAEKEAEKLEKWLLFDDENDVLELAEKDESEVEQTDTEE